MLKDPRGRKPMSVCLQPSASVPLSDSMRLKREQTPNPKLVQKMVEVTRAGGEALTSADS